MLAIRSPASARFLRLERSLDGRYILDLRHSAIRMMYRRVIKVNIIPLCIWNFDVVHQTCIPRPSKLVGTLRILRFPRLNQLLLCQRPLLLVNRCIPTVFLQLGILFPVTRLWARGQSTTNGTQIQLRWQKCRRKKSGPITVETMGFFMLVMAIVETYVRNLHYLGRPPENRHDFARIGAALF